MKAEYKEKAKGCFGKKKVFELLNWRKRKNGSPIKPGKIWRSKEQK